MKQKKRIIALLAGAVICIMLFLEHSPIVAGGWTKQTLYLWLINFCHIQAKEAKPKVLLIDDDSGNGIYAIKQICDELNIKATFAVIPTMMSDEIRDSLRCWQKEGFGIAIHGYNHDDWREWDYKEVFSDINACERWLTDMGFNIYEIRYVVPPHGSNNMAIRKAIKDKEYQMVMGANMINPDTTVFQMGRVFISRDTNIEEIVDLLKRAKKRNCYVIFGSHSSIPEEFALEKTKAILSIAIKMGFNI